jgi:tRNA(Ile)-lysidine synthase TilS/MesJ
MSKRFACLIYIKTQLQTIIQGFTEQTIIRPLAMISEADLKRWAALNCYQPVVKICPFDDVSNRTHIERVANEMERLNDDYRHSLWHALHKSGALVE